MAVAPGDMVRVPFGAQELQGIVFSTAAPAQVEEVRSLIERLEGGPFISPERLELARWVASYYRTTLYLSAALMLPPGGAGRVRTWLTPAPSPPPPIEVLNQAERRAWDFVAIARRVRKDRLVRRLGRAGQVIVDRMLRRGYFVAETVTTEQAAKPAFERRLALAVPREQALAEAERLRGTRSARRGELMEWLCSNPPEANASLARKFGVAAVKAVTESGVARVKQVQVQRDPLAKFAVQQAFRPDPTPEQTGAIEAISHAIDQPQSTPPKFLLFGVTGSGKTEVYLRAVQACLDAGKRAIVLVPEIALTPQTLRRFASRFPGKVALQHSGLSAGERYDQWWKVKSGAYPIVLGSRSAVFAPVEKLGLVVIDEEHEWTYKQADQAPRYHARDVAERLCALSGAVLVCGSATPDLTTFRRAGHGEFRLLRLPGRLAAVGANRDGAPAAGHVRTEIVDVRDELRSGHTGVLSRPLLAAMRESLTAGGKVVLFLNRRGVASFVQCRECGAVRRCRRCDTALTYHRPAARGRTGELACHYCSYRVSSTRACPVCRGVQVLRLGPGTQAVADAVQEHFPRAGVLRWDSDTARTAKDHERILAKFEEGVSRVLVGTQVIAKGLDIPSVTLSAAVSADVGLAIPDYRASERTFQLLTQAVGRTGRGARGGRAVIQTFQPEHPAVQAAAAEDYEAFYQSEAAVRARYGFPPFTRLIRLLYSSPDAVEAAEEAQDLASRLQKEKAVSGDTSDTVIGPSPAYPLRVRGRYRWQVIVSGPSPASLLDRVTPGRGWTIDVDPVSLA